jgi:membrane protease subunit HflK
MSGRLRMPAGLRGSRLVGLGVLAAILAWVASGFYTVPTTSLAVTRAFGVVVDRAVPPGVHWWWPRPVGRVDRAEVTRTLTLSVGFLFSQELRGIQSDPALGRWLTGDTNVIQIRAKVNFRVADPATYLFGSEQPERILPLVVGAGFTEAASGLPVDDLLTSGRLALIERVRTRAQEKLDAWGVGLQMLAVNLEAVEPPQPVVAAFQDVQNARADRERLISEAEAYASGLLPTARGEADRVVNDAISFRDQRVNAARGDADRFAQLAAEYRRAPAILERRLYLETAERVLPRVRRYVLDPGGAGLPVRIVE